VHARLTLWMLLGSAPMSLAGVGLATWLKHRYGEGFEGTAEQILGAALVLGGLGFLAKAYLHGKGDDRPFLLVRRDRVTALLIGLAGGFVVGLTSVGSGTFFGLAMLMLFPLTAAKIVGTDIFHAAALLWVAGLSHLLHGNVDLGAMGWLLVGSIPGVLAGSRLTVRLPERTLRIALASVLLLSGIKLLDPPGSDVLVAVVLPLGGVALAALLVRRWLVARPAQARR
jgi:hypothetical protein